MDRKVREYGLPYHYGLPLIMPIFQILCHLPNICLPETNRMENEQITLILCSTNFTVF